MAQTGYTPILIYSSSTAAAAPTAGNLTNSTLGSELAINITDGKLFYKDNANAIQVIGWKIVPATAGGTGQTSYVQGDLLYATSSTALGRLADVATGNALISGGVGADPAWGKIGLTTHVSGTLPVANGGTGTATAFTAGSVVFAGASGVYSQNNASFFWDNSNTRLGIGTSSPTYNLELAIGTSGQQSLVNFRTANATAANNAGIQIFATPSATATSRQVQAVWDADGANSSGGDYFLITKNGNSGTVDLLQFSNASMRFGANYNGRAAIDMTLFASGGVSIGNTTDPGATNLSVNGNGYIGSASQIDTEKLGVLQTANAKGIVVNTNNASFTSVSVTLYANRNTTNNTFYYFQCYNSASGTNKLLIADSGNVTNTNGSYGTISDFKLKQDIIDASSQWNDIKNIRLRKYRWKSDVAENADAPFYLGLIAQEAEQVSPGLVEEHIDRDDKGDDLGTITKSVKTSILYMKAIKALQEAMERIEVLETEVKALKDVA